MKITDIQVYPVAEGNASAICVVVDTDEGIYGVGEAGVRTPAVVSAIESFKEQLVGEDPFRISHLWQIMYRGGFFPAKLVQSAAASAIDIALWDIKGKALGVPVYELLGGRARDKVICYPHNGAERRDDWQPLIDSCLKTIEEGWKFVRFSIPYNDDILEPRPAARAAVSQLTAVREAIGPDIEICYDVHTRFDLPEALYLCNAVEELDLFFIEDPLRSENPDSFKMLRPRTSVPLAAGEQFGSKWQFRQLIEEDWIDYARIDLCIAGGISEAMKIAGWCETHYIRLATHNPLGPISSAACLHLNLACPNVGVQEQPRRPGTTLTETIPVQMDWEDGYLLAPTRPGLGVEFDREAAKRHPLESRPIRSNLRRLDGSFTNW